MISNFNPMRQRQKSLTSKIHIDPRKVPIKRRTSLLDVIKFVLMALAVSMAVSLLMTSGSSLTWNYQWKSVTRWLARNPTWNRIEDFLWGPKKIVVLTVEELKRFDGREGRPAYLGIDGHVFDVSAAAGDGGHYGPSSSYKIFLGKDATRAFITGCFIDGPEYATHDLRGFTRQQLDSVAGWLRFYQDHAVYRYVGRLSLPPIDPGSPIPPLECKQQSGNGNRQEHSKKRPPVSV